MTIQIKATEQYFIVELFIMLLYKVVLTSESVDETPIHINAIEQTVFSFGTVY